MDVMINDGGPATGPLQLRRAVLLYERGRDQQVRFASVHDVDDAGTILPGAPITTEALGNSLKELLGSSAGEELWTPVNEQVLATGPGLIAWWTRAQTRHLHYIPTLRIESGPAPQPALFWVWHGKSLYVFALASDQRPDFGTELLAAPYLNIWKGGRVCLGSSALPAKKTPEGLEDMFYASRFTHPNDGNWQTGRRGGITALCRYVRAKALASFPVKHLAPANMTIGKFLNAVTRRGQA